MITIDLFHGLNVIKFTTTKANICKLYFVYYGWPIDAPHRKIPSNPIRIDGSVVINGFKRHYKELQTTLQKERFWKKITKTQQHNSYVLK